MAQSELSWYQFSCSSSQKVDFQVASIDGQEALGTTYRFVIDLVSSNLHIDLGELIQKSATLVLSPWNATQTVFNGMITQAESFEHVAGEKMMYRVILEPRVAQLADSILNAAYSNDILGLSTADILKKILERNGFNNGVDFDLSKLSAPARKRVFVMQYQESDLDFMHRWCEFEGIFYYFIQDPDKKIEKIIFIDNNSSFSTNAVALKFRPYGSIAIDQYQSSLTKLSEAHRVVTREVHVQNYNFRKSQNDISAKKSDPNLSWGKRMWFGGDFRDNNEANHYAKIRFESLQVDQLKVTGRGFATGIYPGSKVSIDDHPRGNLNTSFRVTSVHHQGSQAGFGIQTRADATDVENNFYQSEFTAIPEATPFRMAIKTPRPMIAGYLPAIVQSDMRGNADLDRWGRYRVKLVFENSGEVSTRVRLATPYNSPSDLGQSGMHFPLLPHSEVMLAFMDGDPDQMVIAGALNNSQSLSPVNHNNPAKNRMLSKIGNEVHLDDDDKTSGVRIRSAKGSGMFFIGSFGGNFD
jgi:type VI secretion system secreted protein VgrG